MYFIDSHLNVPLRERSLVEQLRQEFTRPNPKYRSAKRMGYQTHGIAPLIALYDELLDYARFPREAVQFIPSGERIEDRTSFGQPWRNHPRPIILRSYQVEPVDEIEEEMRRHKSCTAKAAPGAGKTVMSLEVARRLGRKTGVLVHTEFLLKQWQERIDQFLGITSGLVQGDTFDVEHDIVLMMAQTLNAREFEREFYESFGLIVTDEAHRFSADTFQQAIVQFPATYRLGVTATPQRQDELEWIFYAHIGPVAVDVEVEMLKPDVYVVPAAGSLDGEPTNRAGNPDFVKIITLLSEIEARNHQIVDFVYDAARNDRRVIVFSDRREHLVELAAIYQARCNRDRLEADYGFFIGGMKESERELASAKRVIFSTYQFAKEGLDIPELSTCVLATPKKDIIQTVGRIQRHLPGKPHPVVIDIADTALGVGRGLLGRRLRQYRSANWNIHDWRD
jgi:superfamily II DNA or RNA helicase